MLHACPVSTCLAVWVQWPLPRFGQRSAWCQLERSLHRFLILLPHACARSLVFQVAPEGTIVVAGQSTDGVALGSYPLAEDGNYQFWVFSDAYKATITKEKGREIEEVEEDVYETYNLACLCLGTKDDATFKAQGVRVNGTKYTVLRELGAQTYQAKVSARASWGVTGRGMRHILW